MGYLKGTTLLSILSDLFHGKITFHQAAVQVEAWVSTIFSHSPSIQNLASDLMTDVKQGASDVLALADTELGKVVIPFITDLEPALDAVLIKYLGPVGTIAAPLTNDAINKVAATVKQAVDTWTLQAQAKLTPPPATGNPAVIKTT